MTSYFKLVLKAFLEKNKNKFWFKKSHFKSIAIVGELTFPLVLL